MSKTVLALLAAGQSRRFGEQDKLAAQLHGKMLGLHSAETFVPLPFMKRYVVSASVDHPCAKAWEALGYDIIINPDAANGQSTSTALAAQAAIDIGADSLFIALADMPFVTATHIENLLKQFSETDRSEVIASNNGKHAMPPAVFPRSLLPQLVNLSGDHGARAFLKDAKKVRVTDDILMDIDTPEALAAANAKKP